MTATRGASGRSSSGWSRRIRRISGPHSRSASCPISDALHPGGHPDPLTRLLVLDALFGVQIDDRDLESYCSLSGGAPPPKSPAREAWIIAGRRAGKSIVAALVAVYLTCCRTYTLAPGEVGVVGFSRKSQNTVCRPADRSPVRSRSTQPRPCGAELGSGECHVRSRNAASAWRSAMASVRLDSGCACPRNRPKERSSSGGATDRASARTRCHVRSG